MTASSGKRPPWMIGCMAAPLAGEKPMQRIDASFLYSVGTQIHPIGNWTPQSKLGDVLWPAFIAQGALTCSPETLT